MTDLTPSPRCTVCGSDDLDANTWEAWCYACDRQWTLADQPDMYQPIRDWVLDRLNRLG